MSGESVSIPQNLLQTLLGLSNELSKLIVVSHGPITDTVQLGTYKTHGRQCGQKIELACRRTAYFPNCPFTPGVTRVHNKISSRTTGTYSVTIWISNLIRMPRSDIEKALIVFRQVQQLINCEQEEMGGANGG